METPKEEGRKLLPEAMTRGQVCQWSPANHEKVKDQFEGYKGGVDERVVLGGRGGSRKSFGEMTEDSGSERRETRTAEKRMSLANFSWRDL